MSRLVSSCSTVLLGVFLTGSAGATPVLVPDNYSTIQAAIDAGEQEIQVRDGLAPERLRVGHAVSIEPAAVQGLNWFLGWESMPSIYSIEWSGPCERVSIQVRGARFVGPVHLNMCGDFLSFERCRFDSGFVAPEYYDTRQRTSVRGCMILGGCRIHSAYTQFVGNVVIGGTAEVQSDGDHDVRFNYVIGPADPGLELRLQDSAGNVTGNTVRGATDGIRVHHNYGSLVKNSILDCSGDGIAFSRAPLSFTCDSNVVVNCGGAGIAVREESTSFPPQLILRSNSILGSGQQGVFLPTGIVAPFANNLILDSRGDGIHARYIDAVSGNVIGRSGGAGIRTEGSPPDVHENSFFSNAGPGIVESNGAEGRVHHNIFAFNGGPGIVNPGGHPSTSDCNDWFANGGDPIGISYGTTDRFLDPLFCDRSSGDGHLASNSPLLAAADCGLIGALGIGCSAVTTDVHPAPSPPIRFAALPMPASGGVSFVIPTGTGVSQVEVFSVTGSRIWSTTAAMGTGNLQWDLHRNDGTPAPPGIYFARLRQGDREVARTRIVLTK